MAYTPLTNPPSWLEPLPSTQGDVAELEQWCKTKWQCGEKAFWYDALQFFGGDSVSHIRLGIAVANSTIKANAGRFIGPLRSWQERHIPYAVRRDVLAAGKCLKCGSLERLTVDHIVPFSRGGGKERSNLQCLCLPCNIRKGARV